MTSSQNKSWPYYSTKELKIVQTILKSGKVNYHTGDQGKKFEEEFARQTNSKHAIAVSNGTVALELALNGLNIGAGDDVIVTPRTFLASASSIVVSGARPVFADIDPNSQNITAKSIEAALTSKTKAVICVHLAGWPCEMDEIMALAKKRNLFIIEDCAQAHGATYKGKPVGSIGHIGAWSFCQDKIMTTAGEGGMVTTNSTKLWSKMWAYKDHGKSWEALNEPHSGKTFRWVHHSFGTNWRLTEIQSAIGRIQLTYLQKWHKKRINYAKMIWDTASKIPALRVPPLPNHIEHAAYKCYIFINPQKWKLNQHETIIELNKCGTLCLQGSCSEIYREKAFHNTNFQQKSVLPIAKELGETSLMFLVHPTLSKSDIKKTCLAIQQVFTMKRFIKH